MRILITGSREWIDKSTLNEAIGDEYIKSGLDHEDITLVHGTAPGADSMAAELAEYFGFNIEAYPADWEKHGRRAGFVRNAEMVKLGADICLAFIRNESKGATMTADLAEKSGIPVRRYISND